MMAENDAALFGLAVMPMIMVIGWHFVLLFRDTWDDRPHTISGHAVWTQQMLRRHRVVHILGSVVVSLFGVIYLWPQGYVLAGWLLIGGAFFDILEVITLDKRYVAKATAINRHTITAWAMAVLYLAYACVISVAVGFSSWYIVSVLLLLALVFVVSYRQKFQRFWIAQHMFFCLVALMIAVAHTIVIYG